jgi:UDP-N-acetylglucosamine transferase subunit ALG13
MILATVGAQMPFPRLINALDEWAEARNRTDVFAQIGPTSDHPRHMQWTHFLLPSDFRAKMQDANAVIAHAGMGTIITALCLRKPLIVMPRLGELMETRNDHQVATAAQFAARRGFMVANNREELFDRLDRLQELSAPQGISEIASDALLQAVRSFILGYAMPEAASSHQAEASAS